MPLENRTELESTVSYELQQLSIMSWMAVATAVYLYQTSGAVLLEPQVLAPSSPERSPTRSAIQPCTLEPL